MHIAAVNAIPVMECLCTNGFLNVIGVAKYGQEIMLINWGSLTVESITKPLFPLILLPCPMRCQRTVLRGILLGLGAMIDKKFAVLRCRNNPHQQFLNGEISWRNPIFSTRSGRKSLKRNARRKKSFNASMSGRATAATPRTTVQTACPNRWRTIPRPKFPEPVTARKGAL